MLLAGQLRSSRMTTPIPGVKLVIPVDPEILVDARKTRKWSKAGSRRSSYTNLIHGMSKAVTFNWVHPHDVPA